MEIHFTVHVNVDVAVTVKINQFEYSYIIYCIRLHNYTV